MISPRKVVGSTKRSTSLGIAVVLMVMFFVMTTVEDVSEIRRMLTATDTDEEPMFSTDSSLYKTYLTLTRNTTIDIIYNQCKEGMENLIEWADVLQARKVYVYSKCGQERNDTWGEEVVVFQALPNMGKEGHSWLTHMLRDDVDFADWNLFLQGNPESQMEHIVKSRVDVVLKRHNPPYNFVDLSQYNKNMFSVCYRNIYAPCPFGWSEEKTCEAHNKYRKNSWQSCEEARVSLRGEFWVTKGVIKSLSSDRLEPLVKELEEEVNPRIGHFLERSWINILGATDLDVLGEKRGK